MKSRIYSPRDRKRNLRALRDRMFLIAMVKRGYSCREIATLLDVHRTTVRERMRKFNIEPVQR